MLIRALIFCPRHQYACGLQHRSGCSKISWHQTHTKLCISHTIFWWLNLKFGIKPSRCNDPQLSRLELTNHNKVLHPLLRWTKQHNIIHASVGHRKIRLIGLWSRLWYKSPATFNCMSHHLFRIANPYIMYIFLNIIQEIHFVSGTVMQW